MAMLLFRFGAKGKERPAVLLPDGKRLDVSSFVSSPGWDFGPSFFADDSLARLQAFVQKNATSLPAVPDGTRFGPCVARPHKMFCIGLNYKDHARETGATIPSEPVV
ncbi:MAG: ureidoglycolate lyase, partial [Planctomycetota bacterium]